MDEAILEAVSQNDEAYEGEMLSDDEPFDVERPSTADSGGGGGVNKLTHSKIHCEDCILLWFQWVLHIYMKSVSSNYITI